jgi:hypothetical protein
MQTVNVMLNAQVSLRVLGNARDWRFDSWRLHDGTPLPPPRDLTGVTFASPLAAADFFRALHQLGQLAANHRRPDAAAAEVSR